MRIAFVAIAVCIVAFLTCRNEASARVQFCNATPQTVSIALAFEWTDATGEHRVSQGWYPIPPAECQAPATFEAERMWFYYARDSEDTTWNEPAESAPFCIDLSRNFQYVGANSGPLCGAPVQTRPFKGYAETRDDRTIALLALDRSLAF